MTLDSLYRIVQDHTAKTGPGTLHLLMNCYTWDSIVKEVDIALYASTSSSTLETGEVARIFGVAIFLNEQVPNDAVYPMYGDKPGDKPCFSYYAVVDESATCIMR